VLVTSAAQDADVCTYQKSIVGASKLLSRSSARPADPPRTTDLGQLDTAGASLQFARWCSGCADGSSDKDEEVGELHFDVLVLMVVDWRGCCCR